MSSRFESARESSIGSSQATMRTEVDITLCLRPGCRKPVLNPAHALCRICLAEMAEGWPDAEETR